VTKYLEIKWSDCTYRLERYMELSSTESVHNVKNELTRYFEQLETKKRKKLLFTLIKVQLVLGILGILASVPNFWLYPETSLPSFIVLLAIPVTLGISFLLARLDIYQASVIVLILCTTGSVVLTIIINGIYTGAAALLIWPIFISALLLKSWYIAVTGTLELSTFIILALLQTNAKIIPLVKLDENSLGISTISVTVFVFLLLSYGIATFSRTMRAAIAQNQQETLNLAVANQDIERRQQASRQTSTQINNLAHNLAATSRQQASGANEQVAAVVQVTSSLEELSETARHIALNANIVAKSANSAVGATHTLIDRSSQVTATADQGQTSVEFAISGIEQVQQRIEALAQRLLLLTEKSQQIGNIINLINEIADETHLLALNAAIESAGAGETGRRFGVIANQVKSLADRSLEATRDVKQVITEVQGAVASSVLAAEEGKKESVRAVEKSYRAGLVIGELGKLVEETAEANREIVQAIEGVHQLAEEIGLATKQQESASGQIVMTMRQIGEVARESATASHQLQETVETLQTMSGKLSS
jgi:methyl-accepting chemotaxis protein